MMRNLNEYVKTKCRNKWTYGSAEDERQKMKGMFNLGGPEMCNSCIRARASG